MNRKVLVMAVACLAVAMLATPLVGTAQAWRCKRNVKTVTLEPFVDPPTSVGFTEIIPPTEKIHDLDDGSQIRIAWGALRDYPYAGELGEGVFHLKTILSIGKNTQLFPAGVHSEGSGLYQMTLEITTANPDEDYGTGTFKGYVYLKYDWYFAMPPSFDEWWTISLCGNGLKVYAEAYGTMLPPYNPSTDYKIWWTTTSVVS